MTYIDGFLVSVPNANKAAYQTLAAQSALVFKEYGALSVMEAWGDDVPEGKVNSMHTAVLRKDDESIVFSWIVWPSKAARDAAWQKVMADPRMQPETSRQVFDGQRMIWGGFVPLIAG